MGAGYRSSGRRDPSGVPHPEQPGPFSDPVRCFDGSHPSEPQRYKHRAPNRIHAAVHRVARSLDVPRRQGLTSGGPLDPAPLGDRYGARVHHRAQDGISAGHGLGRCGDGVSADVRAVVARSGASPTIPRVRAAAIDGQCGDRSEATRLARLPQDGAAFRLVGGRTSGASERALARRCRGRRGVHGPTRTARAHERADPAAIDTAVVLDRAAVRGDEPAGCSRGVRPSSTPPLTGGCMLG